MFLTFPEMASMVIDWYKLYYSGSKKIQEFSFNQIRKYEVLLKKKINQIITNMRVILLAGGFGSRLIRIY